MTVQAVIRPSRDQLLIVRGSERVRPGIAQSRRPTRTAVPDAVQPPKHRELMCAYNCCGCGQDGGPRSVVHRQPETLASIQPRITSKTWRRFVSSIMK